MREIEPHVGGVAALRVPQEGIVDYPKVCETLVAKLPERGTRAGAARRACGCPSPEGGGWRKPRRVNSKPIFWSTVRAFTAIWSRKWPANTATRGLCRFAANIIRSVRTARA